MSAKENKAIARRFFGILDTGDLGDANEVVAANYVNHNPVPGQQPGREGFKALVSAIRSAFPDLRITIEDQVAEGDKVVTRYTVRGTHQGQFVGVAATGKSVTWTALALHRITDGKIQELWLQWDRLGLMQQLGVIPTPEKAGA